jgi:hypothetical protein
LRKNREKSANFLILFSQSKNVFYQKVATGEKRRNIDIITAIAVLNKIIKTVPFHRITFAPSRGPNGSKLNVAKNA